MPMFLALLRGVNVGKANRVPMAELRDLLVAPERFVVGKSAAYLLCARGILECKVAAALAGKAGRFATSRNWATVLKLQSLLR